MKIDSAGVFETKVDKMTAHLERALKIVWKKIEHQTKDRSKYSPEMRVTIEAIFNFACDKMLQKILDQKE